MMTNIKLIERLYVNSYISFVATLFAAVLAMYFFQGVANKNYLIGWLVCFFILSCFRLLNSYSFFRSEYKSNPDFWFITFICLTFLSGTLWGLTGYLFFYGVMLNLFESVLYHGMLLLFVVALVTGSLVTYTSSKLVYLSFSIPAIVPQCLMLIFRGDKYHTFLGGFVLAYACIMFVVSIYLHRIFSEYAVIEAKNEQLTLLAKQHNLEI